MTRNVWKRIVPFLLVLLVLVSLPLPVRAADVNLNTTGSVRVHLHDVTDPDNTIGGTLTLYKVGEAAIVNSALTFVLTPEFAGSGVSLEDLNTPDLAAKLAAYGAKKNLSGTDRTVKGSAVFSGLSTGLYLVVQTKTTEEYLPVSPFLVSLPMYDAEADSWIYRIEASPKVQRPAKDPVSVTVVKKWLDNNTKRPTQLTVQLLKDGQVQESVILTKETDWQHTWTGLNAYYKWTVQEVVPTGYQASYETYGNKVTITNKASWYVPPADVLIQTGQLNWPVPVLACAGLFLLLVGCILLRKGKEDT